MKKEATNQIDEYLKEFDISDEKELGAVRMEMRKLDGGRGGNPYDFRRKYSLGYLQRSRAKNLLVDWNGNGYG